MAAFTDKEHDLSFLALNEDPFVFREITEAEIILVPHPMSQNKVMGHDGMTVNILKENTETLGKPLAVIAFQPFAAGV